MMRELHQRKGYRLAVTVILLLSSLLFIRLGSTMVVRPSFVALDDYVEYWSAGRLNLSGANPYDRDFLTALQLTTGRTDGVPVMMWNPPWTLALVMPLSVFSYPLSRVLWFLLNLVLTFACADWLWRAYGGATEHRWVAWGIAFTFSPVLHVMKAGQIAPLLLSSLVGFLYFSKKRRWWFAGVAAALMTIKPHLLYLFGVVLLLWVIHRRRWSVAGGFVIAVLGMLGIAWIVNPNLLTQYLYAVEYYPPVDWATPTLGAILRLLLGIDKFWLQFVPSLVGIVWALIYWQRHHDQWDWLVQLPLMMVVSVVTTSYGWTFDYIVLLPVVIEVALWLLSGRSWLTSSLVIAYLIVDAYTVFSTGYQIQYWWFAPYLLIWYLLARRVSQRQLRVPQPAQTRVTTDTA